MLEVNVKYSPKQVLAFCRSIGEDTLAARIAQYLDELDIFISDGCTLWPDEYKTKSWQHCCIIHDIAYWVGGTQDDRFLADCKLAVCVCKIVGYKMAETMFAGVRAGQIIGSLIHADWRWGYGRKR